MTTTKQTVDQLKSGIRQSIITRPVKELGQRDTYAVFAACAGRTLTVPWDDALDIPGNHAAAALKLMAELGWDKHQHLVMGSTPDELGYVFVQVEPRSYPVDGLEYYVDDCMGRERVFKSPDEAAGFAVAVAMSGKQDVNIDVLCWNRQAAIAYTGDDGAESYDEDPEASVHDRIRITAESTGRVA